MALVIAGERSGVGKTTVTLALLAALRRRSDRVQSFKVGPDYIDPMFHHHITGHPCRNLDPVLTSETYVQDCFARHTQAAEFALVEGVMGLFDGASGSEDIASTAHIARLLDLPVLLVLDCSRMSRSAAAIAHGFRSFDPRLQMAGVVLNRVGSDRHLDLLKAALEPLNLPILGILRRDDAIALPDRHLGLVPTAELPQLNAILDRLATLAETAFAWKSLLPLLQTSPPSLTPSPPPPPLPLPTPPRIAIAHDPAFNFYYADNLDLLQTLGAELVFWSPLNDKALPPQIHGLYFGGGFPEVFAAALSHNVAARKAVYQAVLAGIPTYAECGGLMYLSQQISDFAEKRWPMVGVLPTQTHMGKRLVLGYRRAIARQTTPLLGAGMTIWGHEFHRSHPTTVAPQPLFEIQGFDPSSPLATEGWCVHQVHASYVHLHWGAQPALPRRFIQSCVAHSKAH